MRTLWAIILTARHDVSHWYNIAMVPKKVVNCSVTDLKTHPNKRPFMPNIVNLIQNPWLKRSEGMLFRWINIALTHLLKAALSIYNRSLSLQCIEVNAKIHGYTTCWEWSTVDGSALNQTLTLLPWGPRIISEDEIEQKRQKMGTGAAKCCYLSMTWSRQSRTHNLYTCLHWTHTVWARQTIRNGWIMGSWSLSLIHGLLATNILGEEKAVSSSVYTHWWGHQALVVSSKPRKHTWSLLNTMAQ